MLVHFSRDGQAGTWEACTPVYEMSIYVSMSFYADMKGLEFWQSFYACFIRKRKGVDCFI